MQISRRDLLFASGPSLLLGTRAFGQGTAAAQSQALDSRAAPLLVALQQNRLPLTMSGGVPAGAGWDWLVREARASHFTLIGEEHGVVETAQFSAALFDALRGAGYRRIAIELSPPMAQDIEAAARRGVQGISDFITTPGIWGAVYDMREEAEFLAAVVKTMPKNERVLWGLDRDLGNDPYLISKLEARVPRGAREAFVRLKEASSSAWVRNQKDPGPHNLFSLSGDPALVSELRTAWANPDRESDTIMRTLEESLEISAAQRTRGGWAYGQRRAAWKRSTFAARLKEERGRNWPKVMLKFGYNHMIRGANYVNVFDLGAMTDEVAALEGGRSFHILVIPGRGSRQAVFGARMSYVPVSSDEFDEFRAGDQRLTRVLSRMDATGHEVIDFNALRQLAMRGLEGWNPDAVRTIHGYDAAVIWKGAQASSGLR